MGRPDIVDVLLKRFCKVNLTRWWKIIMQTLIINIQDFGDYLSCLNQKT